MNEFVNNFGPSKEQMTKLTSSMILLQKDIWKNREELARVKKEILANREFLEEVKFQICQAVAELKVLRKEIAFASQEEVTPQQTDFTYGAKKENSEYTIRPIQHNDTSLATRSYNCLMRSGFKNIEELGMVSKNIFRKIGNAGKKTLNNIYSYAEEHGVTIVDNIPVTKYLESLPDIDKGDYVVALVDNGNINKGDIMVVEKVTKCDVEGYRSYWIIPHYRCRATKSLDGTKGYVEDFSVSEIKKV